MKRIFIAHPLTPSVSEFVTRLSHELESAGYEATSSAEPMGEIGMMAQNIVRRADLVLGVVTDYSPNVFFEIGCAVGAGRKVLLLGAPTVDMPFDLKSFRFIKSKQFGLEDILNTVAIIRDMHEDVSGIAETRTGFREILQTYRTDPNYFESVTPNEFEECIFDWCEYKRLSPQRPVHDSEAGYEFELRGYQGYRRTLVDCKKYGRNSRVSVGHIQRLLGVMIGYDGDHAIMIATSPFTRSAIDFSSKCEPKIELWDMGRILDEM